MSVAATSHRRIHIAAAMLLAILTLPSLSAVGRGDEPGATEKKDAPAVSPEKAEIDVLFQQGMALSGKGQWAEAAPVFEKAAARAKVVLGPKSIGAANLTIRYANALFHLKQYDKAVPLFVESLAVLRRHVPRERPFVTYAVNNLAASYFHLGRHAEAAPLFVENLKVREASLGKDHPQTLLTLKNLGENYEAMRQWEDAIRCFEDWLQRNERGMGERSPKLLDVLVRLGVSQRQLLFLEPAEKNLLRALDIQRARKDADPSLLATTLMLLADVSLVTGPARPDRVKLYADEAYQIRKRLLGPSHPQTTAARGIVGEGYERAGKYVEAEPLLREAIKATVEGGHAGAVAATRFQTSLIRLCLAQHRAAEAESLCLPMLGLLESHCDVQSQINDWQPFITLYVDVCNQSGRRDEGKARLTRLLANVEKRVGREDPFYAQVLATVGTGYREWGLYAEARECLLQSISTLRARSGPQCAALSKALFELGCVCNTMSSYAEAEPYLLECLRIRQRVSREGDIGVADCLNQLGFQYVCAERFAEAEKCFNEVLTMAEKNPRAMAGYKARALDLMGALYGETGRPHEGEELVKKALALEEQRVGPESNGVAWMLIHLGEVCYLGGRREAAEQSYRKGLRILEASYGKDNPMLAASLFSMSRLLLSQGRCDEADTLLAQSNQLFQAHPDFSRRVRLATLDAAIVSAVRHDDYQQAIRSTTELRRLSNRWLKSVLPGLPPAERTVYLGADHWWGLARSMSVGLRYHEHPEAVEASAQWLLNGKGVARELLADEIRRARQSDDPAVAETLRRLAHVRDQLAHRLMSPPTIGQVSTDQPSSLDLLRRERQLSMQLGLQTFDKVADDAWIALEGVREAIPADAVLIDVFRFPVWRFGEASAFGRFGPAQYVAWVIPPAGKGAVKLVDLGLADVIDGAVARFRQGIDALWQLQKQSPKDPATLRAFAESARPAWLSELVWKPLQAAVGDAKGLIVSPDGALWLIPWAALLSGPTEYLVEQKRVRYVVSGRALLAKQSEVQGRRAVLFADPDYDRELVPASNEEIAEWAAAEKRDCGKPKPRLPAVWRVERLPNAEAEGTALAKALEHYLHEPPVVYKRGEAQERTFKRLENPRMLVVATHGSFQADPGHDNLPSPNTTGLWGSLSAGSPVNRERSQSVINPLLRCSLALAGANHRWEAHGGNDGMLTGMEILNTDLRGTDLVVLLACQTGLGAVQDGEGVAGLHHAFQLAGARSVLASLWSIPAEQSGELVQAFLENLAIQPDKALALRKAQLAMIAEERNKYGVAHPAVWAGLVLVGRAQEPTAKEGKK